MYSFALLKHLKIVLNFSPKGKTRLVGNPGASPLQKYTAAIRMLAYGIPADALDDYLKIGESTILECTKQLVKYAIECFGDEYMRRPNEEDLQRLLHYRDLRGFPGANNDINVIDRSPLFNEVLEGRAPNVSFTISSNRYDKGYYLIDGIYPNWAVFVKSVSCPELPRHKLFAKHQESARKDVERAFGVLQARFAIVRCPERLCDDAILGNIMRACIIIHNMFVEDERDEYMLRPQLPHYDQANTEITPPEFQNGYVREFASWLQQHVDIRSEECYQKLQ